MAESARVVIVGGGAIGLSVAYHLAKLGIEDVLLLERHQVTSGTSWHAAGIVGPLRASMNLTKLSLYSTELFAALEAETGQATGYRQTGGLWLAQSAERLVELQRLAAMGELAGLDARLLAPKALGALVPRMEVGDLQGGLWVGEDGQVNPVDLCRAYLKGAKAGGLRLRENCPVASLKRQGRRIVGVVTDRGETIVAETVVLAGGVWSRGLAADAGIAVPVQAVEHMYVVTEPLAGLPQPFPILRDLDGGIYVKEDAGKLVLGGFEPDAKSWDPQGPNGKVPFLELPEDWAQFEPFMTAGLKRLPLLEAAGIQHFMNGPEGFTPDTRQVMGPPPGVEGLYVAAGFNSIGIVSSAGAGKALAEWILAGAAPLDLWEVDIARFSSAEAGRRFLETRVQEAVGDQFALHWPFKQKQSARGLRRLALHRTWVDAGAVFGAPAGWERPLWFAETPNETTFRYSQTSQSWWPMARREALALRDGAVLFDLSPFGKFDIQGPDSLALLQRLAGGDLDVAVGRAVYCQLLNARGGIEADVTVTRRAEDRFRLVSAAPSRWKDLAWLRAEAERWGLRAEVFDATSAECVLGLMGPDSRRILEAVSGRSCDLAAFPLSSEQELEIGLAVGRALRLSYVGEQGWEISVPTEMAGAAYEALVEAGGAPGLRPAGLFCLESCRLEKGYRHWGHDIGPDDSPLEAGLGFALAWDKPGGFQGREALLRQREAGVTRRLLLFALEGEPLLLHDEPIYREGRLVGRTTSGGLGFRSGSALAMGYVACRPGAARAELLAADYKLKVAGQTLPARALARPPYDPDGLRLRGQA
ncbi:MAG: FAD-dependent oxidoreductase [Rhodospirillales bacterium]